MKPILMNSKMVRAILEGRKTVTRRLIKPQPTYSPNYGFAWKGSAYGTDLPPTIPGAAYNFRSAAPYQPGDILYVRETWAKPYGSGYKYAADYNEHDIVEADAGYVSVSKNMIRWKPSIHMPKEAARIFLRVKSVRIERIQDISEKQAFHEGIDGFLGDPRLSFANLWNSTVPLHERSAYGWEANPWVWAIEFEKYDKDTDT